MNDDHQRDQELDGMLEALRGEAPTHKEIRRWQGALAPQGPARRILPALAAGFLGLVVGASASIVALHRSAPLPCVMTAHQELAQPSDAGDATFELTYVKLD